MYPSAPSTVSSPAVATTTSSTSSAVASPAASSPAVLPVVAATSSSDIPPIAAAPVAIAAAAPVAAAAVPIGATPSTATIPAVTEEAINNRREQIAKVIDAITVDSKALQGSRAQSEAFDSLYRNGGLLNKAHPDYRYVTTGGGRTNLVTVIRDFYGTVTRLHEFLEEADAASSAAAEELDGFKADLKEQLRVIICPNLWQLKDNISEARAAVNSSLAQILSVDESTRKSSTLPLDGATIATALSKVKAAFWGNVYRAHLYETCRHLCQDPINDASFLVHTEHLTIGHTLRKYLSDENRIACARLIEQDEKARTEQEKKARAERGTSNVPPLLPERFMEGFQGSNANWITGYRYMA